MDLGTGDGSYVINNARAFPDQFFIGIDSNADNLCDASRKTAEFSSKKGLKNALFIHAGIENLPEELHGVATQLTVLLPWGSLLKAVALPDIQLLKTMAKLCSKNAKVRIILGFDSAAEQKVIHELGLPKIDSEYLQSLPKRYLEAGFSVRAQYFKQEDLKTLPTTWAKKLAYGKNRQFIEIVGKIG